MSTKTIRVGRTDIVLPADHALDRHQARWKRYDRALGDIASFVEKKYPGFRAIDIGANVGDTAALICAHHDVPTLCVEGHPAFIDLLRENARRIGPHIFIEPVFIGETDSSAILRVHDHQGTATLIEATEEQGGKRIHTVSLGSLLAKRTDFLSHRLLKIDTDGFDFQIINSSVDILRQLKPIVFYEYAPFEQRPDIDAGLRTYQSLVAAGYCRFMVYLNFGHYLAYLTENDYDRFVDLNAFLCSNRVNGLVIPYFDICAFAEKDREIFEAMRRHEVSPFINL
jgi:FkbM family methyltransferase